jgi:Pentapeptide repeats (9 copies)
MASAPSLDWEQCTVEGCEGSRSHENGKCLAHLGPAELGTTLERIAREDHLDARGVEISSELLGQILAALPRAPEGSPRFGKAEFRAATFTGDAVFDGSVFAGDASFLRATFRGRPADEMTAVPPGRAARPEDCVLSRARRSFATSAPCVLASERPSHPDDERHSAKAS